jgi:hypothetical protein
MFNANQHRINSCRLERLMNICTLAVLDITLMTTIDNLNINKANN